MCRSQKPDAVWHRVVLSAHFNSVPGLECGGRWTPPMYADASPGKSRSCKHLKAGKFKNQGRCSSLDPTLPNKWHRQEPEPLNNSHCQIVVKIITASEKRAPRPWSLAEPRENTVSPPRVKKNHLNQVSSEWLIQFAVRSAKQNKGPRLPPRGQSLEVLTREIIFETSLCWMTIHLNSPTSWLPMLVSPFLFFRCEHGFKLRPAWSLYDFRMGEKTFRNLYVWKKVGGEAVGGEWVGVNGVNCHCPL